MLVTLTLTIEPTVHTRGEVEAENAQYFRDKIWTLLVEGYIVTLLLFCGRRGTQCVLG